MRRGPGPVFVYECLTNARLVATWPVMAIASLLGGIDPVILTMAFVVIVAVAVLGCSFGARRLPSGRRGPTAWLLLVYAFGGSSCWAIR